MTKVSPAAIGFGIPVMGQFYSRCPLHLGRFSVLRCSQKDQGETPGGIVKALDLFQAQFGAIEIQRFVQVVDLERYVPAFLTWIANKLSRGASQHYLSVADVGIETWRCLVLLAIEGSISAQQVSKVIGMDKGSVSRCFKSMQAKGLITLICVIGACLWVASLFGIRLY